MAETAVRVSNKWHYYMKKLVNPSSPPNTLVNLHRYNRFDKFMDSFYCTIGCYSWSECEDLVNRDYDNTIQNNLDAPMPWIGMYIAAASAICSLAMVADGFNGFRSKKLWFPCKYFSLNATSLTLLTVSMKLTMDLTSSMMGINDKIANVSSQVLMSTAVGNFMISVASMDDNEILLNLTALGILVLTIAGNICIHNVQTSDVLDGQVVLAEQIAAIAIMLILVVMLCFSSVVVSTAKRYIESKYQEMHKFASNEIREGGKYTVDELRVTVKKYWVMAETGSPQFVMARSAISGTSGLMCLLMALTLVEAHVRLRLLYGHFGLEAASNYKWSINWIFYIQSIGVALGTIAPLSRWFLAGRFKISETGQKSLRDELKIESYWTSRLVEWRESSLPLQIRHQKCRKLLHDAKRLVLNICIGVQILFVLTSKLVLFVSAIFGTTIFLCFHHIKNLKKPDSMAPNDMRGLEYPRAGAELDFSHYVLLLEGEAGVPKKILQNICNEVDKLIQIGERKKSKNLIKLLHKSVNFNGVREFDSNEIPSLHSQGPPNCWSLPVVTLTSIAIALPNITNHKANELLSGVSEGLSLIKLIEKTLDRNGEVESIRNAADMVWVGVELYRKWQDKDLQSTSLRGRAHKETLQKLSSIAEKIVKDFKIEMKDILMQNPLNWPLKVIAANSMYRITQTILLAHKDDKNQTDEELFERLSIMISDVLAACLTNLVHTITFKCHRSAIKEREKSVRQAAILLGESQEILEILRQHELPSLDPEKAANIDEWRAFMEPDSENPPASGSASGSSSG